MIDRGSGGISMKALQDRALAFALIMVMLPMLAGVLDGFQVAAEQVFDWFRTGTWTSHTTAEGLARFDISRPQVEWVIPQRILDWVMDGPRAVWLPLFGLIYALIAVLVIGSAMSVVGRQIQKWRSR